MDILPSSSPRNARAARRGRRDALHREHAANFLYLPPAVATMLSMVLTDERPGSLAVCDGLLAIAGVSFVAWRGRIQARGFCHHCTSSNDREPSVAIVRSSPPRYLRSGRIPAERIGARQFVGVQGLDR